MERYDLHSRVTRYVYDRRFHLPKKVTAKTAEADWGFLQLEKPLGRIAGFIGYNPLRRADWRRYKQGGAKFVQLGYRRRRSQVLSGAFQCPWLGFLKGLTVAAHGCIGEKGESGGPLLMFSRDRLRVVAVQSMVVSSKQSGELTLVTPGVQKNLANPKQPILQFVREKNLFNQPGRPPPPNGLISPAPYQMIAVYLRQRGWLPQGTDFDAGHPQSALIAKAQKRLGLVQTGKVDLNLLAALMGMR
jgi:hypothetical protein